MSCFLNPALWIWIIVAIGAVKILKIIIPWIVGFFELPAPAAQIIMVILWVVIACFGVYVLFDFINCFASGMSLSSLRPPLHR